ncbi:MAG: hypothetical protein MR398_08615 [Oscillospiraceae bacterium]|nr:hypothetical protein [Oscillospiraceae bacterium]
MKKANNKSNNQADKKRLIRNIVMILAAVALCAAMVFTYKAQIPDNTVAPNQNMGQSAQAPSGQNPPSDNGTNQSAPPSKPDENGENKSGTSDNSNNNNSTDNSKSDSQSSSPKQGGDSSQQPPSLPTNNSANSGSNTALYILFGIESIALVAIIAYLIMSGLNKKGLNATLKGNKRLLAFVLAVLIAGGGLTAGDLLLSNKMRGGNYAAPNEQTHSADASGATEVDGEQTLSAAYTSTKSDENAILVQDGGNATVSGATVTKSGDSTNTENSEFYGINAAVLTTKGSTATIKNSKITTSAKGANAVFSTGEDSKVYISDSTVISTGESSARGLDATYGGYIEADNVTVSTQGNSCAALATDRGEGTVTAKSSELSTTGTGSPIIYSTGNISISDTKGSASNSQMVVVEGKNSAAVTDSALTCSGKGNRGTDNKTDSCGVMIYQSMSGDAGTGEGTFTSKNSTLTVSSGSDYYKSAPMFFVTNTDASINLTDTKLSYGSDILLSAKGTSEWGNSGSNGGNVTLTAKNQTLKGNITADKISTVTIKMASSNYTGTINGDNSAEKISLTLDSNSKIKLTGDSYVTSLSDSDGSYSNIDLNGYTLYVNGKALTK